MKKVILSSLVALLFLTSCKDAVTKVSDTSSVLVTIGNKKITKGEVASAFSSYKYSATLELVKKSLYDEYVPINDEVNQLVSKKIEEMKKLSEASNVKWEDSLKNANITEEEYKTNVLLPSIRADLLAKKYVNEQFATVASKFGLIKFEILEVSSEENANKAIEQIKAGKSFEETAKAMGVLNQFNGKPTVAYVNSSVVVADVYTAINASEVNTVQKVTASSGSFYVYRLISKDPTQFKDEAITSILTSSIIVNEALGFYIAEKKIKIYDIDVYKQFEENYKSAIQK